MSKEFRICFPKDTKKSGEKNYLCAGTFPVLSFADIAKGVHRDDALLFFCANVNLLRDPVVLQIEPTKETMETKEVKFIRFIASEGKSLNWKEQMWSDSKKQWIASDQWARKDAIIDINNLVGEVREVTPEEYSKGIAHMYYAFR